MTYFEACREVQRQLAAAGNDEAAIDSRYLVQWVSGLSGADYLCKRNEEIPEEQLQKLRAASDRRAQHEPLQYILGDQEFMGLTIKCSPACLIPRQDTEILAEQAIHEISDYRRLNHDSIKYLDLCTGSGCVALAVASIAGIEDVTAIDISEEALQIARDNSKLNKVRATFLQSDLFENVKGKFDFVTANPPYIESEDIDTLMPEVAAFEPRLALDGGADGLCFYRRIINEAPRFLKKGGRILFEIGPTQGEAVGEMLSKAGFTDICVVKDLAGLNRVVKGVLK